MAKTQLRGEQIKDETVKRDDIERDYADAGSLRAEDLPYNAADSIKKRLDDMDYLAEIGGGIVNKAVTATLHVSRDGDNSDGLTWDKAYTTIQAALDAASTDTDACTLILISPHAVDYDIATTGDPTWSANVILKGSHRNWASIVNNHGSATSVLKLTGRASLMDVTIGCGSGGNNGLILTSDGARLRRVYLECESVTEPQTAIELSGGIEYAFFGDVMVHGVVTQTTGLLLNDCALSRFEYLEFIDCLTGVQITHADSDENLFRDLLFHYCTTAMDLAAGTHQVFSRVAFHDCTTNIDDAAVTGNHTYFGVQGAFPVSIVPDDLVGVLVNTHANPNEWGGDTQIRAAGAKPFRIAAVHFDPSDAERYRVRFTDGTTYYDDVMFLLGKKEASVFPGGTEFIFNKGVVISASARSVSGGNSVRVWIEVQEI